VTQLKGGQKPVPAGPPDAVDTSFLRLSLILTGFDEHVLYGTGMLQTYYDELLRIIGAREAGELFGALAEKVRPGDNKTAFQKEILSNRRYGPVARNVLRMWYMGIWKQLPREWRDNYGATSYDTDHVVSAAAYRESLVWPAAGTHPMGAKAPGFGTWANASALPGATGTEPTS
jgi:hypothetical protein